jgi:DNA mismatch endonuclease, patch repair protein
MPKSKIEYWKQKLDKNVERDEMICKKLKNNGWQISTVWECETEETKSLNKTISSFLTKTHPFFVKQTAKKPK